MLEDMDMIGLASFFSFSPYCILLRTHLLVHVKLLWHLLLHWTPVLKHRHLLLLHLLEPRMLELHLANPCPPDADCFRAPLSEIELS